MALVLRSKSPSRSSYGSWWAKLSLTTPKAKELQFSGSPSSSSFSFLSAISAAPLNSGTARSARVSSPPDFLADSSSLSSAAFFFLPRPLRPGVLVMRVKELSLSPLGLSFLILTFWTFLFDSSEVSSPLVGNWLPP